MLRIAVLLLPTLALAAEPKTRTFRFNYEATVTGLKPGDTARVWLPVPQSFDDQEVLKIEPTLPADAKRSIDRSSGNEMYYVSAKADAAGTIPLKVVYTMRRREVLGQTDKALTADLERFLKPDPLAPSDGKHLKLIEGLKLPDDPMAKGQAFYHLVNERMKYDKTGTKWGRGDVDWVCDSRYGNCTDFHSLFNALCRSQKIPARFEIGFGLPEKRGTGDVAGYHCWAKFKPAGEGRGWVPVDISEANKNPKKADYYFGNLTEDRVTFTSGRGLTLSPMQDGPALNFFVYPYVEVAGQPYPADKITRKFRYEDVADVPMKAVCP